MKYCPVIWGGYKTIIIRIPIGPIKQPGFNWKAFAGLFSGLICCCFSILGFLIRRKVSPERMMFFVFLYRQHGGNYAFKIRERAMHPTEYWQAMDDSSYSWLVQKSGDHQLRLVVDPSIYEGFIHPMWLAGFLPLTVSLIEAHMGNDNHLQVLVDFTLLA